MVGPDESARPVDLAVAPFAALVVFFGCVQVLCLGTSLIGGSLGRGGAAAIVAVSVLSAILVAARVREQLPAAAAPTGERIGGPLLLAVRATAALALIWALSVWVRLWVLAFRRPPYDWDGLYYHLPAVHEWVRMGRVGWLDSHPDVPFVNFPMAVEANAFVIHQLAPSTRLIDAWNLWYWPLAFLAVVVVAGRLGAGGAWRWLAGALLAGAPVLVCQSVTCYVDPGFAACVMAAVAASVLLISDDRRILWWKTLIWGASVGLTLGAKGIGAVYAAVFVVTVSAAVLAAQGRHRWREWAPKLAVAVIAALAVGGYWYGRNVYHAGNPIYPHELRLGHKVLVAGYDFESLQDNMPAFLRAYPEWLRPAVSWLQLDSPIHGYAPVGGLGYIWILAGLPAAIWVAARACRRAWRRMSVRAEARLLLLVALTTLLFFSQIAAWWSRFTVWLHVLGLPGIALALRLMSSRGGRFRPLAVILALGLIALAVFESERTLAIEWSTGRVAESERSHDDYLTTLERLFPQLEATAGFDRFLAADRIARSRWSRAGTLLGGALAMPLGQREIRFLPAEPAESDLLRLRQAGVRWVLWDVVGAGPVPAQLRELALEEHVYSPTAERDFRALLLPPAPHRDLSAPDSTPDPSRNVSS